MKVNFTNTESSGIGEIQGNTVVLSLKNILKDPIKSCDNLLAEIKKKNKNIVAVKTISKYFSK